MPLTTLEDKSTVVVRTACGGHRFMLLPIEDGQTEIELPLLPYKKNAVADYYLKNIPEGTLTRKFEFRGNWEFGAYDTKCRVFEEVI